MFVRSFKSNKDSNASTPDISTLAGGEIESFPLRSNETPSESFKRRKKLSISPPATVEISGIDVHFPFQPYSCQVDYMRKVIEALQKKENALLESPTGTGKTLCLLCSTLAWQRDQAKMSSSDIPVTLAASINANKQGPINKVPTILYASRTHSQLTQVVNELRNTRYRPQHAVLGSREQLCINPKVKTPEATAADINLGCQKLTKDRKCKYKNNLEGFSTPYADAAGNIGQQPVMDIEELYELGKKKNICPFYHTRNNLADAEIIFLPYNYLFDKEARTQSLADVRFENAILIFDESHNLESFASDSASFDLSGLDIGGCIHEVSRAIGYFQSGPEALGLGADTFGSSMKIENLIRLKAIFLQLEGYLENEIPMAGGSYTGEYIFEIFAKGAHINFSNHGIFLGFLRQVSELIMEVRGTGLSSSGTPKLDHFASCVKRVFATDTEGQSIARARSYRVHITPKSPGPKESYAGHVNARVNISHSNGKNPNSGRVLSYWCFAPALAMNELKDLNVRSIIVTSGTLSPLSSYSFELGIPFAQTLENPHIISNRQICVKVIGKGVSGKVLCSNYERREDTEYINELGNTIISLIRVIPAGVLIFFPSYGVLENCVEKWGGPVSSRTINNNNAFNKGSKFFEARKNRERNAVGTTQKAKFLYQSRPSFYDDQSSISDRSTWKRMLAIKSIVLEPKISTDLSEAIEEYERQIRMPNSPGCLFLGVCRGKISEGIDFADDRCRAVIITGLPFPPYHEPKVKLKREYLDALRAEAMRNKHFDSGFKIEGGASLGEQSHDVTSLSGSDYYNNQAFRAVNQAIGRVIRHRADYGAVLLLDQRFEQTKYQTGLSKWMQPHIEASAKIGPAIVSLKQFFNDVAPEHSCQTSANNDLKETSESGVDHLSEETIDVKKVVVVRQEISEVKDSHTSDGHLQMTQEASSYIHPDRIIKTMDLNSPQIENISFEDFPLPHQMRPSKTQPTAGLESLYKQNSLLISKEKNGPSISSKIASAWSILDRSDLRKANPVKIRIVEPTKNHDAKGARKPPIKVDEKGDSAAHEFFKAAKGILCSDDFEQLGTCLKSLQSHGSQQDIKSYLSTASQIIDILLRSHTKDHNIKNKNNSVSSTNTEDVSIRLVNLFFEVLPTKHKSEVMKIAGEKAWSPTATKMGILEKRTSPSDTNNEEPVLEKWLHKIKGPLHPDLRLPVTDGQIKDVKCLLCKENIVQPYLAECRHIACCQCWVSWLAKSQSCPFCRKPMTKENLAKMVIATGTS